ncbi:isocitrate lyase/phosphoenolpyruvate mutase family protein [Actinomadura kijaniata]|uniref:isocitrate lyase/phosphoenolpyruvate mutase family protein n=1 Tax=Actinomadura kijaniata TaxID=46161 RepID=UPI0031E28B63
MLPNAWDPASAVAIEAAGAAAIATTSAGLSWAAGVADAGGLDRATALRRIVAAVSVPVTADIEAGYGELNDLLGGRTAPA